MERLNNFLSRSGSSANKGEKSTKNANANELAQEEPIPTIEEETENEKEGDHQSEGEAVRVETGAEVIIKAEDGDEGRTESPVAVAGEEAKKADEEPNVEGETQVEGEQPNVEGEAKVEDEGESPEAEPEETEIDLEAVFRKVCDEVNEFLESLPAARDDGADLPDVPECFEKFNCLLEEEIKKYESEKDPGKWCPEYSAVEEEESLFVGAIAKASCLTEELSRFPTGSKYAAALDRATATLHRAMLFLEDEFRCLLAEGRLADDQDPAPDAPSTATTSAAAAAALAASKTKKLTSFVFSHEQDRAGNVPEPGVDPPVPVPEKMHRLTQIATLMISAGYAPECCHAYCHVRMWALEESLTKMGLEKFSIDDIQKMSWETLEAEIATWTKACKRCAAAYFPGERRLCEAVFPEEAALRDGLVSGVARGVAIQLLNFAQAVVMTKRSVEKLFKFLDVNEALRDLMPVVDELFADGGSLSELKMEAENIRSRLGEAAVGSFSDLENSIKADGGKTPVPNGAVHPLTRYVMNYLKYACGEYKDTIEKVFQDHNKLENNYPEEDQEYDGAKSAAEVNTQNNNAPPARSPFLVQLSAVMDLLDSSLEAKSKLYKDPPLSYIFLMNNGRYIMQKIKESSEMRALLGDNRKRSSELRQYHKNYTRETWSKLLACLKHDGLMQGKGTVNKPALKERFKSFNAQFEEILKTQSSWVVSDEQLQSELRVSITAVMVPAYRSFLARFQPYLDPGRQTEKYIKFGPEELESFIDDLFDGTQVTMARRR